MTAPDAPGPGRRAPAGPARFIPSPKVRAYLYGILVAAGALLVYKGIITAGELGLWLALGGAVLGLGNALALANTPKDPPR